MRFLQPGYAAPLTGEFGKNRIERGIVSPAIVTREIGEEGIFAGFSSGANVAAALRLAQGRTVVTVINDSGLKYLSTDLWE